MFLPPPVAKMGFFYADFMRLLKFLNATYFLYYFLSLTPVAWVPTGGHFIFLRVEKAYMFTLSSQCWSVDLWSVWFTKLDSTFFPLYSKNAAITGHKHVWRHELLSPSLSESLFLLVLKM